MLVSPVKAWVGGCVMGFGDGARGLWGEYAEKLLAEDPDALIPFNVLLHTVRVVEGGCEMRHRYWLGKGIQNGKVIDAPREGLDMKALAWTMCRHSLQEYSNLASFLPQLYHEMDGKIDTKYESDFKTPEDYK